MSVEAEGTLFGLIWAAIGVAAMALLWEHIKDKKPPDWWTPKT